MRRAYRAQVVRAAPARHDAAATLKARARLRYGSSPGPSRSARPERHNQRSLRARGQFALVERPVGEQHWQAQRPAGRPSQVAAVGGHPLPRFGGAEAFQLSRQRFYAIEQRKSARIDSGVCPGTILAARRTIGRLRAAPGMIGDIRQNGRIARRGVVMARQGGSDRQRLADTGRAYCRVRS